MSTEINLTARELAELKELTKESNPAAALRLALKEYIRFAKRQRLKELAGAVTMTNNWQELEEREMKGQHGKGRSRSH